MDQYTRHHLHLKVTKIKASKREAMRKHYSNITKTLQKVRRKYAHKYNLEGKQNKRGFQGIFKLDRILRLL